MLVPIILFFALPMIGVGVLILLVGERTSDRTLHRPPSTDAGIHPRPH